MTECDHQYIAYYDEKLVQKSDYDGRQYVTKALGVIKVFGGMACTKCGEIIGRNVSKKKE